MLRLLNTLNSIDHSQTFPASFFLLTRTFRSEHLYNSWSFNYAWNYPFKHNGCIQLAYWFPQNEPLFIIWLDKPGNMNSF